MANRESWPSSAQDFRAIQVPHRLPLTGWWGVAKRRGGRELGCLGTPRHLVRARAAGVGGGLLGCGLLCSLRPALCCPPPGGHFPSPRPGQGLLPTREPGRFLDEESKGQRVPVGRTEAAWGEDAEEEEGGVGDGGEQGEQGPRGGGGPGGAGRGGARALTRGRAASGRGAPPPPAGRGARRLLPCMVRGRRRSGPARTRRPRSPTPAGARAATRKARKCLGTGAAEASGSQRAGPRSQGSRGSRVLETGAPPPPDCTGRHTPSPPARA